MQARTLPAILEKRLAAIASKMRKVSNLVDIVQVDITDGQFVPSRTYARSGKVSAIKQIITHAKQNKLALELDLMVDLDQPKAMTRWSDALVQNKPDRVVFHLGSTYRWDELFERLHTKSKQSQLPFSCGLAVRLSHTRSEIRKVLESHSEFEYIQIMGIEKVGYSGQTLSPKVYDRIRKIRRAFGDMPIQIDGGVKERQAQRLLEAGADRLGMNSGLFKSGDIAGVIERIDSE
jgi:ribulose-phosphate 3-epimerase